LPSVANGLENTGFGYNFMPGLIICKVLMINQCFNSKFRIASLKQFSQAIKRYYNKKTFFIQDFLLCELIIFWGNISLQMSMVEKILKCQSNILRKKIFLYQNMALLFYLFITILYIKTTRVTRALRRTKITLTIFSDMLSFLRI
jgi:hypothetical protein